ncbi:MAG: CRISPR-associated helicase Cas3' [Desulfovibrionaceae bacterium]
MQDGMEGGREDGMEDWSYWGKTREGHGVHLLAYHGLDVAAVAQVLLERDRRVAAGLERTGGLALDVLRPWLLFLAALHDLGKFHPGFQAKAPEAAAALGQPGYLGGTDVAHWDAGLWLWKRGVRIPEGLAAAAGEYWGECWALEPLAEAAFGHHGRPADADGASFNPRQRAHVQAAQAYADEAAHLFLAGIPLPEGDERTLAALSWPFAGLMILADWMGSAEQWFAARAEPLPLAAYWGDHALPQARRAVAEAGVLFPSPAGRKPFGELFPGLADREPTPLQRHARDAAVERPGPQLHVFEDLTGSGKTEAALLCVNALMDPEQGTGPGGLYLGLPTMATANAMYARMADSYRALFAPDGEAPSLMLAHSARNIHDEFLGSIALERAAHSEASGSAAAPGAAPGSAEGAATCAAWLADNRKKALLAPCGVGTLDQALLAVLPARHQALRLLGLGRLVLVADEVHAYDAYTRRLLCALLEFLAMLGASAVVLTATLPQAQRQALADAFRRGLGLGPEPLRETAFPLATRVDAQGCRETPIPAARRLEAPVAFTNDPEAMYAALVAAHRAGACACWIRNTVDQALEACRRLTGELGLPASAVTLFHARFALGDRLDIEAEVLRRFGKASRPAARAGRILIATQVVEQSLDLDFDLLLSDLAPMDLLIQRAGRCHRHLDRPGRPEGYRTPRLLVLAPEPTDDAGADWYQALLGNAAYVYPERAPLWRTVRLLAERGAIRLPEDARHLLEGAYDAEVLPAPEAMERADAEPQGVALGRDAMARYNELRPGMGYCAEASGTLWAEEERTPTRIGEDRVTVRLVRVQEGVARLWAQGPGDVAVSAKTCARSELSVSSYRVGEECIPERLRPAVDRLRATLPDQGRHGVLVALEPGEGGAWTGRVAGGRGASRVSYDPTTGLEFLRSS